MISALTIVTMMYLHQMPALKQARHTRSEAAIRATMQARRARKYKADVHRARERIKDREYIKDMDQSAAMAREEARRNALVNAELMRADGINRMGQAAQIDAYRRSMQAAGLPLNGPIFACNNCGRLSSPPTATAGIIQCNACAGGTLVRVR